MAKVEPARRPPSKLHGEDLERLHKALGEVRVHGAAGDGRRAHRRDAAHRGPQAPLPARRVLRVDDAPAEGLPRQPVRRRGGARLRRRPAGRRAGGDHALRQPRARCSTSPRRAPSARASTRPTGAATSCSSPRAACPSAPLAVVVHLASVWVPFTSEAKEAVAHYDELLERDEARAPGVRPQARRPRPRAGARDARARSAGASSRSTSRRWRRAIGDILGVAEGQGREVVLQGAAELRALRRRGAGRREGGGGAANGRLAWRGATGRRPKPSRLRPWPQPVKGKKSKKPPSSSRCLESRPSMAAEEDLRRTKKTERDALARQDRAARAGVVRTEATKGDNPAVEIRTRALSNVSFNEKKKIIELGDKTQSREFFNTAMARKFMQTMLVASGCKTLIDERQDDQHPPDVLHDQAHARGLDREHLRGPGRERSDHRGPRGRHRRAARGAAPLREPARAAWSASSSSTTRGDAHRSVAHGHAAAGASPASASRTSSSSSKCKAEFILFVEKEAVFSRLNEDGFWKKHNCILMTSSGQATRGARRLLQRMSQELKLPIYVLVDNDPVGALHLLGPQAGQHQPGLRVDAHGGPERALPRHELRSTTTKFKLTRRGADQAQEGRHRARRADEGVPLVQGQEVAARDPGAARTTASRWSSTASSPRASPSSPRSTSRRSCGTATGCSDVAPRGGIVSHQSLEPSPAAARNRFSFWQAMPAPRAQARS